MRRHRPDKNAVRDGSRDDDDIAPNRRYHQPQRHELEICQGNENGGEQKLVGDRIEHTAQSTLPAEPPGQIPIDTVRCGSDKK